MADAHAFFLPHDPSAAQPSPNGRVLPPYPNGFPPPIGPPAGLGARFLSFFLDNGVVSILAVGIVLAAEAAGAGDQDWVFGLVVCAVSVYWTVPVALWGRTLGRLAAGTRVVDAQTGYPPELVQAVVRAMVFAPCALFPLLAVFLALWSRWDPRFRTLWDRAGGTCVVRVRT
ncbi:putative RDD family membrane protein YckC [Murinocardiopsis flavida]|uniref:Putative RDD family membrane protein YckC n=1 Tax=Murinocardiopsis flavida TaxID=645275 RepID=A0A2P8DDR9_9ACTN|nr:RDD family protein [Murinocardiopsis flavida]PSK95374.1 putative RDD family membrane protein YckC [Murinocardiopsis flavida]